MELDYIQKLYYEKIKSERIKELFASSKIYLYMEKDELDELLMILSVIHTNKSAEKRIVKSFEELDSKRSKLFAGAIIKG